MGKSNYREIPVLIIGYSRVSAIREVIRELLELGTKSIFLALDFSDDTLVNKEQVKLVEELLSDEKDKSGVVKVWYRGSNHGVAVGVISALDWFFSFNEVGIVIEDDLLFNVDFLEFCATALERYENSDRLLMISGNRFDGSMADSGLAVTSYPQIWGWATWRTKWLEMRNLIISKKNLRYFECVNPKKCFFFVGAKRAEVGDLDTWDTPLAYEMYRRGKLCLLPPVNLVSNIGVDSYAAHTFDNKFPLNFPTEKLEEVNYPDLESLMHTRRPEDDFLEKTVFKIRAHHIVSPIKLLLQSHLWNLNKNKRKSLLNRLNGAENYQQ